MCDQKVNITSKEKKEQTLKARETIKTLNIDGATKQKQKTLFLFITF